MFKRLRNDPLVSAICDLNDAESDRKLFHQRAESILKEMDNAEFCGKVLEANLKDPVFLNREWSNYEIPHLNIHESDDFYLKYHIFLPVKSGDTSKSSNIVHHHNNYILSSLLAYGKGYHTMHFGKEIAKNADGSYALSIEKDFFHERGSVNVVDSWEPHIVFNMDETTATLVLWSPDQKRITDGLRNHPAIKPFKGILLKVIHGLGANNAVGVAPKDVMQFYLDQGKMIGVKEADYFDFYKDQKGPEVDSNYTQAICHFMQLVGYRNESFLQEMLSQDLPAHWNRWLSALLQGEEIPAVYGKEKLNTPSGEIRLEELRSAING